MAACFENKLLLLVASHCNFLFVFVQEAIYAHTHRRFILYPRMWTRRKKGWGKKQARQGLDENAFRDDESFFMDRFRCKKLPLHLTEKPISVDSPKKAESLERGQSKKVWNEPQSIE